MTINVKAYANADDVLIAWQPDTWPNDWVGFQLERRNNTTQQSTILSNRIPPKAGEKQVPDGGISGSLPRLPDVVPEPLPAPRNPSTGFLSCPLSRCLSNLVPVS